MGQDNRGVLGLFPLPASGQRLKRAISTTAYSAVGARNLIDLAGKIERSAMLYLVGFSHLNMGVDDDCYADNSRTSRSFGR